MVHDIYNVDVEYKSNSNAIYLCFRNNTLEDLRPKALIKTTFKNENNVKNF